MGYRVPETYFTGNFNPSVNLQYFYAIKNLKGRPLSMLDKKTLDGITKTYVAHVYGGKGWGMIKEKNRQLKKTVEMTNFEKKFHDFAVAAGAIRAHRKK